MPKALENVQMFAFATLDGQLSWRDLTF